MEVAKELLDRGADPNATKANTGATALMGASHSGHLEVAKLLIDYGAVIDQRDAQGATPLFIATFQGRLEVVKLLLDRGATIDRQSNIVVHHPFRQRPVPRVLLSEEGVGVHLYKERLPARGQHEIVTH